MASNQAKEELSLLPMVLIALVIAGAVLLPLLMPPSREPVAHNPIPLPELFAGGWINAEEGLDPASLHGKVVAIDVWAIWCQPCREAMPRLAEIYATHRERDDFVLVGLTPDPEAPEADGSSELRRFMSSIPGFDWPVGHDARMTTDMLGVSSYPTMFVFDRRGQSVWSGWQVEQFAEALEAELSR